MTVELRPATHTLVIEVPLALDRAELTAAEVEQATAGAVPVIVAATTLVRLGLDAGPVTLTMREEAPA